MIRRTICGLPLVLAISPDYSSAQPGPVIAEFNDLTTSAFRLADQVKPESERLIRQRILAVAIQAAGSDLRRNEEIRRNLKLFLIAVLSTAVAQRSQNNGLIVLSEASFRDTMLKVCPLFPFC